MDHPMHRTPGGEPRRTHPHPLILAALAAVLASCVATRPVPEPLAVEPQLPWESMSAFIALGEPGQALAAYEKAVAEQPDSPATRLLHARLLMLAGRLDEAREELGVLAAGRPADAEVFFNLSLVEGLAGRTVERRAALQRVIAADPGHAGALAALGDLALEADDEPAAAASYERALAGDPGNLVALMGQGEIAFRGKRYEESAGFLSRAIASDPTWPFSYVDRARARRSLGDAAGALEDLTKAIELDPEYPWTYVDRGRVHAQMGKSAEAIADFTVAIRLEPSLFAAYAPRAELLYRADRRAEAAADYTRALELRPDYWYAHAPLGVLLYGEGSWDRAHGELLAAYEKDPEEHAWALLAALALRRGGDARAANAELTALLGRIDRDSWYGEVARCLLDPSADFALTSRIERERNQPVRARMLYYLAEASALAGRRQAAQTYLFEAKDAGAADDPETRLARWELAKLGVAP
jgi:tetratricopeptide (TPR) repeat protein